MTFLLGNTLRRALLRWCAALAFCLPLRHRSHFWARALGMLVPLTILTQLLNPLERSSTLLQQQISLLLLYAAFFLLLGGMIFLSVDIDWKGALYCAVWSLLAAQTAYEGWSMLEHVAAGRGQVLDTASPPTFLLQILTGALFFGLIHLLLGRRLPYKGKYCIGPRQLICSFFIGTLFMLQAAVLCDARVDQWPLSLKVTMLIGQLYFLTLLYVQTDVFKMVAMQKEMDVLNLLYDRQRQQYQFARQSVQIINKRCHELRVQIANLRKQGSNAIAPELLEDADRATRLFDANRNTGNEVLDVVLPEKVILCESRGIQLNTVVNGSCLDFIEAGDLYALFANALDYAVESAIETADPTRRSIDFRVFVRQTFVVVNVTSPQRPVEKREGRPAQYELKVLKHLVKKYQGTLSLEEKDGFFSMNILFPQGTRKPEAEPKRTMSAAPPHR